MMRMNAVACSSPAVPGPGGPLLGCALEWPAGCALLSHLEATVVLPMLVQRFPGPRLAGQPQWRRAVRMRQLSHLPVSTC